MSKTIVETGKVVDPYQASGGIFRLPRSGEHREDDYSSTSFDTLRDMQARHFWYRGRSRFLRHALKRCLVHDLETQTPRMIDIGCGCGGWISDVSRIIKPTEAELAVADSSEKALEYAADILPDEVNCYKVNLLDMQWHNRWDIIFLLDVLEHLQDDRQAAKQAYDALSPGGLLFVSMPALSAFWTWNDELAHHKRRYARRDLEKLAEETGFILRDSRYFMFFLSPLLIVSRWLTNRKVAKSSPDAARDVSKAMHQVPHPVVNGVLRSVFSGETPLGHLIRFPWGTSIFGLFQKPPAVREELPT